MGKLTLKTITAIIPAYNAQDFLGEAIQSVLDQTRSVDEIIVVDDCSTDQTREIAESFKEVTYLRTPTNSGHATARNIAIEHVKSDYIGWLDADDVWEPMHLEVVAELLDKHPEAGVACSPCRTFGTVSGVRRCLETDEKPRLATEDCFRWTCVPAMSAVTRTDVTQEVNGFDASYRTAPDFDFWLRMSLKTLFVSTQRVTVNYRWHASQISSQSVGQARSIRQIRSMYRARHEFQERQTEGEQKLKASQCKSMVAASFLKDLQLIRVYYSDEDLAEFRSFTDQYVRKDARLIAAENRITKTPRFVLKAWLKAKRIPVKITSLLRGKAKANSS